MIILTEYYWSKNIERQNEIDLSIKNNCELPEVEAVVVFIEDDYPLPQLNHPKIKFHIMQRRTKFSDIFKYSNENYKNKTCIICNNDISYNGTINFLNGVDLEKRFLCLTRWEVGNRELTRHSQPELSQDSWVFKSPVPEGVINLSGFDLGTPGCDNVIAYVACVYGLDVVNSSDLIQTEHRHQSQYRSYNKNEKLGWGKSGSIYLNILPSSSLDFNVDNLIYRKFWKFGIRNGVLKHTGKVKVLKGQTALDTLRREQEYNIQVWKDQIKC